MSIVVLEKLALRTELMKLDHDAPSGGPLRICQVVSALSKKYYWHILHTDCK